MKAFMLLDPSCSMTVSRSELRRVISSFLLALTREQFQDVLAEVGSPHPGGRADGGQGGWRAGRRRQRWPEGAVRSFFTALPHVGAELG